MKTQQLINDLIADIEAMDTTLRNDFQPLGDEILTQKPAEGKWSAMQCFEHLNIALRMYVNNIEIALKQAEANGWPAKENFSSGWVGNMAANSMKPKADNTLKYKMPTLKGWDPGKDAPENDKALGELLQHHAMMISQLKRARKVDLEKPRVQSAISFLKFKLGDAFRFMVTHDQRHVLQAQRAIAAVGVTVSA